MKLEELFAKVLDVPASSLNDESSPRTIATWDSLGRIGLIMAMEETYRLQFTTQELEGLANLGDVRAFLRQKGIAV